MRGKLTYHTIKHVNQKIVYKNKFGSCVLPKISEFESNETNNFFGTGTRVDHLFFPNQKNSYVSFVEELSKVPNHRKCRIIF